MTRRLLHACIVSVFVAGLVTQVTPAGPAATTVTLALFADPGAGAR